MTDLYQKIDVPVTQNKPIALARGCQIDGRVKALRDGNTLGYV